MWGPKRLTAKIKTKIGCFSFKKMSDKKYFRTSKETK